MRTVRRELSNRQHVPGINRLDRFSKTLGWLNSSTDSNHSVRDVESNALPSSGLHEGAECGPSTLRPRFEKFHKQLDKSSTGEATAMLSKMQMLQWSWSAARSAATQVDTRQRA
eukprot:jgi/Ulvmu1/4655/UM002_0386.1